MPLSEEALQRARDALEAVDAFYERRLDEVDRDVRNLRAYGAPIESLGAETAEAAADRAESFIAGILSS
jgi:hypothetical protein